MLAASDSLNRAELKYKSQRGETVVSIHLNLKDIARRSFTQWPLVVLQEKNSRPVTVCVDPWRFYIFKTTKSCLNNVSHDQEVNKEVRKHQVSGSPRLKYVPSLLLVSSSPFKLGDGILTVTQETL